MSKTPRMDAVIASDSGGGDFIANLAREGMALEVELADANERIRRREAVNWQKVADDLADALEKLDALYRSEQDADAPVTRPEWLRKPWQAYHIAKAKQTNQ